MNEEKMTLKESVRLTLRAWRFYWKNTPRFVLSTVLWALADAVSPYAVVWFSARLVAELSDARDPQALAVDVAWVLGVTALGADLKTARANAYEAVKLVDFEKAYCRSDIGKAIDEA